MTILQNIGEDWGERELIWNVYNKRWGKASMFAIPNIVF